MGQAASGSSGVLFVCTGNICRSPMAERLLVAGLVERAGPAALTGLVVGSAGTWGQEGADMEPYAAQALLELGGDPDDFTARELTPALIAGADLVLTMTRQHRSAAVRLHPRASRNTFTLLEFARLTAGVSPGEVTGDDPAGRLLSLVRLAAARRGLLPPVPPAEDDIPDPYGASLPVFRQCAAAIAAGLVVPLDLLIRRTVEASPPAAGGAP